MNNTITQKLLDNGFETYIVGGAVRDYLLGVPPKDIDIATNATPDKIKEVFKNHKVKLVGESFKVCVVDGIDVATYRKDRYFGGSNKNCEIKVAKTLEEDLSRRDLTINSMALDPVTLELIDPFNGKQDLEDKIIRFTGNPKDRINEDPCRILRALRYTTEIKGFLHINTFNALKENKKLVACIPKERIRIEILKTMKCKKASTFFIELKNIDALKYIFPSLQNCVGLDGGVFHNETVFDHNMLVGDAITSKCPILKLSGYLHDTGKVISAKFYGGSLRFVGHDVTGANAVRKELINLTFSNKEVDYIYNLIYNHMLGIYADTQQKALRKRMKRLRECGIRVEDYIRFVLADRKGNLNNTPITLQEVKQILKNVDKELCNYKDNAFTVKSLALDGNDVMTLCNIPQGKEVGERLNFLFDKVLETPELNNKEDLSKLLGEYDYLTYTK